MLALKVSLFQFTRKKRILISMFKDQMPHLIQRARLKTMQEDWKDDVHINSDEY